MKQAIKSIKRIPTIADPVRKGELLICMLDDGNPNIKNENVYRAASKETKSSANGERMVKLEEFPFGIFNIRRFDRFKGKLPDNYKPFTPDNGTVMSVLPKQSTLF
jgi:hypothetical protein